MKHKRKRREKEAMLAMTTGCNRTHRVEKESDRIVWLSIYLQFSLNNTDWSISIVRIKSTSNHQQHQQRRQWRRRWHHQQYQRRRRNTMVGWNEKGVLFWKNWKLWRFWSRKIIKHEESCVVQNDVQLYTTCSSIITVTLIVCLRFRGIVLLTVNGCQRSK